jgi:hypothetical protein
VQRFKKALHHQPKTKLSSVITIIAKRNDKVKAFWENILKLYTDSLQPIGLYKFSDFR